MKTLTLTDLEDLFNGATILGSGGGGPQFVARQIIDDIKKQVGTAPNTGIQLDDPKDMVDGAEMAVAAGVGSPDDAGTFDISIPVRAFERIGMLTGKTLTHVLSVELGAGNSFVPLWVAFKDGLPFVDAAGADRAIPSLTQCTYASHDVSVTPMVMGNKTELTVTVTDEPKADKAEKVMRQILSTPNFGQDAGIAFWQMNGKTMKKAVVPNAVTRAIGLGAALREGKDDPVKAVLDHLGGLLLFEGKLIGVHETTGGGFDLGRIVFKAESGEELTIYNQNENLIAWKSERDRPVAMGPDLICYLTKDGATFSNAELDSAKGKDVAIIGFPASAAMRSKAIVSAFLNNLRQIGYGGPYVEIEKLADEHARSAGA